MPSVAGGGVLGGQQGGVFRVERWLQSDGTAAALAGRLSPNEIDQGPCNEKDQRCPLYWISGCSPAEKHQCPGAQ